MLRFRSLGSGSAGNATVVEATEGTHSSRLLIDCGFTLKQLDLRLARAGLTAYDIDAVFITHEHADHIGSALGLSLRQRLPVWMSKGTFAAIGSPDFDGRLQIAADGNPITIGALQLRPFTVPHDAREPLQLHCTDGDRTLGLLTDLGHASAHVVQNLRRCDALLLECNHEPSLLAASSYHPALKRRVAGDYGHLSNAAAAALAQAVIHPGLNTLVAAHLSAKNNRPDLARAALALAVGWQAADIGVADQVCGTGWLQV